MKRYKAIITTPFGVTTRMFEAESESSARVKARALLHEKDDESMIEIEEVGVGLRRTMP